MKLTLTKEEAAILIRAAQFTVNSSSRRIHAIMTYSQNVKQAKIKCDAIQAETDGVRDLYLKIKNHFNIEIDSEEKAE